MKRAKRKTKTWTARLEAVFSNVLASNSFPVCIIMASTSILIAGLLAIVFGLPGNGYGAANSTSDVDHTMDRALHQFDRNVAQSKPQMLERAVELLEASTLKLQPGHKEGSPLGSLVVSNRLNWRHQYVVPATAPTPALTVICCVI